MSAYRATRLIGCGKFPIPMRGNEFLALLGRQVRVEFPIPMRGNEKWRLAEDGSHRYERSQSP